jgi:Fe-S-cluster containining protein
MTKDNQRVVICAERCESKCCKSTPPGLTSEDISKIDMIVSNNKWKKRIEKTDKIVHVVEKKNESKDCFFITEKNFCSIYENRPLDCKLFPIFLKIQKESSDSFRIKWLMWHCPLTQEIGVETLLEEAKRTLRGYLEEEPHIVFEYQAAMYESGGYKKKHFMREEIITINKRG